MIKWLFPSSHFSYQKSLEKYTAALLDSRPDLRRFSTMFPYLLVKTMKLTGASAAVLNRESDGYQVYSVPELPLRFLSRNSALIRELTRTRAELLSLKTKDPALLSELKSLGAVLVIPAFSPDQMLVLTVNLGALCSGDDFYPADIGFLRKWTTRALSDMSIAA
jgi:hypothetical protein